MTQRSDTNSESRPQADGAVDPEMRDPRYLAWMSEHVTDLKRSVAGQHFLYWSLAIAFAVGLALQVVGYAIKASPPQEPLGLAGDLLYALGWALWTGVVVVVFVEIIPEAKRRQIKQAIESYEALVAQSRADKTRYLAQTNVKDDAARGPTPSGERGPGSIDPPVGPLEYHDPTAGPPALESTDRGEHGAS